MSDSTEHDDPILQMHAFLHREREKTVQACESASSEANWEAFKKIARTTQRAFEYYDFSIDSDGFGSRFQKSLDSFGRDWSELMPRAVRLVYRFDTSLAAIGGVLVFAAAAAVLVDRPGLSLMSIVGAYVTLGTRYKWPRKSSRDSDGVSVDFIWWAWAVNLKPRRIPWWWNRVGFNLMVVIALWAVFTAS